MQDRAQATLEGGGGTKRRGAKCEGLGQMYRSELTPYDTNLTEKRIAIGWGMTGSIAIICTLPAIKKI